MKFFKIEIDRARALHLDRLAQYAGVDKRISVAVAADPSSHADERRQLGVVPSGISRRKLVFKLAVETRQFLEECMVVIGESICDFIDNCGLAEPKQTRLPQCENGASHCIVGRRNFRRCEMYPIPLS